MAYSTLLFDLDHTLLDSDASEAAAFAETVRGVGLEPTAEIFTRYQAINRALWAKVETGETTPVDVKVRRFEELSAHVGLPPGGAENMASAYAAGLGNNGDLYPGARSVLDRLAATDVTMALVTNGLSEVQRARIERLDLDRYFDAVVISAEVGLAKPGTEIFDLTFNQLGHPDRSGALMIGDSLTSDIQGGTNYGIDTCWYNPHGKPRPEGSPAVITHEVDDLKALPDLI